jgi:hypothetical protein
MSNYEYMMGMGTNGSVIELGPGVSVPPEEPVIGEDSANISLFIDKLKAEKGPFVYIGEDSPERAVGWIEDVADRVR